jgi:MFS transporter, PHS family, inorganic phosphate transporter
LDLPHIHVDFFRWQRTNADHFCYYYVPNNTNWYVLLPVILSIAHQLLPGQLSPDNAIIYLTIFRVILGIGVGGDYPMSATVTSDRANLRKRGTMLAYIFSNQGWGSLVGSLATIVVLACYKHVMKDEGKTSKVDGGKAIPNFFYS